MDSGSERFTPGEKVKINAPKENIHGRVGTVDGYTESGKLIYVKTQTGERVWVYPAELERYKQKG